MTLADKLNQLLGDLQYEKLFFTISTYAKHKGDEQLGRDIVTFENRYRQTERDFNFNKISSAERGVELGKTVAGLQGLIDEIRAKDRGFIYEALGITEMMSGQGAQGEKTPEPAQPKPSSPPPVIIEPTPAFKAEPPSGTLVTKIKQLFEESNFDRLFIVLEAYARKTDERQLEDDIAVFKKNYYYGQRQFLDKQLDAWEWGRVLVKVKQGIQDIVFAIQQKDPEYPFEALGLSSHSYIVSVPKMPTLPADEMRQTLRIPKKEDVPKFEYDFFISFASEDVAFAQGVYQELTAKGFRAFFSEESLREYAGQNFNDEIEQALSGSEHFILVCSEVSLKKEWVKIEWQTFHNECYIPYPESRRIIPYPVPRFNMKQMPYLLRRFQIAKSIEDVLRIRGVVPPPPPRPPGGTGTVNPDGKNLLEWLMYGGLAVVCALVIWLLFDTCNSKPVSQPKTEKPKTESTTVPKDTVKDGGKTQSQPPKTYGNPPVIKETASKEKPLKKGEGSKPGSESTGGVQPPPGNDEPARPIRTFAVVPKCGGGYDKEFLESKRRAHDSEGLYPLHLAENKMEELGIDACGVITKSDLERLRKALGVDAVFRQ